MSTPSLLVLYRERCIRQRIIAEDIANDPSLKKYWMQRYKLFSKFGDGIKLDRESWYSVTPEEIAKDIAQKCRGGVIVDAFCGSGGNSIQFAMTCDRVIAIDIDPVKIYNARHNAQIYGVEEKIEFIIGDFFEKAPYIEADRVFLSPPWGGPNYIDKNEFTVADLGIYGHKAFQVARSISDNVAFLLPKNAAVEDFKRLAGPGRPVIIQSNKVNGKLKTKTAYYGKQSVGIAMMEACRRNRAENVRRCRTIASALSHCHVVSS